MSDRNLWHHNRESIKADGGVAAVGCLAIVAIIALAWAVGTSVILAFWSYILVPYAHFSPIDWPQAFLIYLVIALITGGLRANVSRSS